MRLNRGLLAHGVTTPSLRNGSSGRIRAREGKGKQEEKQEDGGKEREKQEQLWPPWPGLSVQGGGEEGDRLWIEYGTDREGRRTLSHTQGSVNQGGETMRKK